MNIFSCARRIASIANEYHRANQTVVHKLDLLLDKIATELDDLKNSGKDSVLPLFGNTPKATEGQISNFESIEKIPFINKKPIKDLSHITPFFDKAEEWYQIVKKIQKSNLSNYDKQFLINQADLVAGRFMEIEKMLQVVPIDTNHRTNILNKAFEKLELILINFDATFPENPDIYEKWLKEKVNEAIEDGRELLNRFEEQ